MKNTIWCVHIWTQLSLRILNIPISTHENVFYKKRQIFRHHFLYLKFLLCWWEITSLFSIQFAFFLQTWFIWLMRIIFRTNLLSWWKFMTEKKCRENFPFLEKLISEGWCSYQRNPHPLANPNIQFSSPMYDLKRQGSPKCPGDWLSFEYYEKSRIYTLRFAQGIPLFLV